MRCFTQFLRTASARLLLAGCLAINSGCYAYHTYSAGGPDGRELGNQPSTEWQGKTLHSLAWGLVRQDLPVDNCPIVDGYRTGMEEIKAETNLGYVLLSAVTVGLWVPLKVSWRCSRPPVPSGELR